jgi:hypothetical protein
MIMAAALRTCDFEARATCGTESIVSGIIGVAPLAPHGYLARCKITLLGSASSIRPRPGRNRRFARSEDTINRRYADLQLFGEPLRVTPQPPASRFRRPRLGGRVYLP